MFQIGTAENIKDKDEGGNYSKRTMLSGLKARAEMAQSTQDWVENTR